MEHRVLNVTQVERNKMKHLFDAWKQAIIDGIAEHPAMAPDSQLNEYPAYDEWDWKKMYEEGKTVDAVLKEVDDHFNRRGW
jgi:hypothetical protein